MNYHTAIDLAYSELQSNRNVWSAELRKQKQASYLRLVERWLKHEGG